MPRTLFIVLTAVVIGSSSSHAVLGQTRTQTKLDFEAKKRQFEHEFRRQQQAHEEKFKASQTTTKHSSIYRVPSTGPISQQPAQAAAIFVQRLRSASSMNQVLSLMSSARQQQLKDQESQFDPKTAHESVERMAKLMERPLTDEEKRQFGSSPFANELRHLKQIAGKAISVKSQSVQGNRATVTVWAHNLAKDPTYQYGLGTFRFVGEGGSWKFDSYDDSGSFFSSMEEDE